MTTGKDEMASRRKTSQSRGRSGGRSGGSGYDYQDLYVALHLAELLVAATRDPVREVLWEKKAVDAAEAGHGVEAVHVDDLILVHQSGAWAYVQLKEHGPRGGWSVRQFIESGVAEQFWRQWMVRPEEQRQRTTLRLATSGDIAAIRDVVDVALRSRTPRELLSAEGSATAMGDVAALARALGLRTDSPDLLAFLQSVDAVHLPDAAGLDAWIARTLVGFGANAPVLADRLVRLVGESKHAGHGARSSYTRDTLIERLLADGVPGEQLVGAGVLRAEPLTAAIEWSGHRATVVRQFERFRLYGLEVPAPVYADLATLFVPPRVAKSYQDAAEGSGSGRARMEMERMEMERGMRGRRRHWHDGPDERDFFHDGYRGGSMDLAEMLSETRRFGLVAGPGTGKTTTLRWLALVSAMENDDGRRRRVAVGLPGTPLIPVYVSFRQFARRVRARGLEGVPGRVALVADFLAAQLESGLLGTPPSRERALQVAEWLLGSDEALLLFDGLDEVSDASMRETLFAAVTDLVQAHETPRVVIATRPSGIRALRLSTKLPFFEPLPLDEPQRSDFARRWYAAVRTQDGALLDPADAEARGTNLGAAAEALSDLTSNPLLLSILALIHFNRGGVPVDRATLYEHATSAMLGHWDRDAAGRDLGEDAIPRNWSDVLRLTPDQIRYVMEDVGWRLHLARQAEIPVATMAELLADAIRAVAPAGGHAPHDRAAVMIQLLADRSGLVLEREPGVLSFAHLSFRDYLAARYRVRVDRGDLRPLVALAADDAHDEVLRFAVGILRLSPDGRENTRALLTEISGTAPMIAATALLDAPDVDLPPATVDALAHGVWMGAERGSAEWSTTSLVLRALLARSADADRLLLALLARTTHREHHPPSELPARALLERPAGPLAPSLAWVLRRVAVLPETDGRRRYRERRPHDVDLRSQLRSLAGLLLVECGAANVADHIEALAAFLGNRFPAAGGVDARGTPEDRARRILLAALANDDARKAVQTRLRTLATAKTPEVDQRAVVRLLVEAHVAATAETVNVLMKALEHTWERDDAATVLAQWIAEPASTAMVTRALERGLASDSEGVRRTASRLLGRVTLPISPSNDRSGDAREEQDRIARIVALLNDPVAAEEARATLDDELWDDDASTAWQAARALAAADRLATPGLARAFVRVGFSSDLWQPIATDIVRTMLRDPRAARATRAALLEGSKHTNDRIAAVSALFLLETDGKSGAPYLPRNVQAALRDESTFRQAVPHIEALLRSEAKDATIGSLLAYIGGSKPNSTIAGEIALLLAQTEERATHAVIRALAMFGCAHATFRPRAMTFLRGLLNDRESTTETRRILGAALEAEDRDVAWSAARLLCERGSFTEAHLVNVLASKGLNHQDITEREAARGWIGELFARPRLAKHMRQALERAVSEALHGQQYNKNYDLAWEAARCLVTANAFEADDLADTLITGGFGERDRHADVLMFLPKVTASKAELADDIEEQLWKKLQESDDDIRWGTACALLDIFAVQVAEMAQKAMPPDDHDPWEREHGDKEATKARTAFAGLVRALLDEKTETAAARGRLDGMLASEFGLATRAALAQLLTQRTDDDKRTTAFRAAERLLAVDGYATKEIAAALIDGGLRNDEFRERAASVLDALRGDRTTEGVVVDALGVALWSPDAILGAAAAAYLASRGDVRSPGVIRALVRAMPGQQRRGWNPEAQVETRLRDAETRNATIGALGALLFDDGAELSYTAARLLLPIGGPATPPLLDVLDRAAARGNALGPLALLALTGRVEDVRAAAGERRSALSTVVGDGG